VRADLPVLLTIADLASLPDEGKRYEIGDGELFASVMPSLPIEELAPRIGCRGAEAPEIVIEILAPGSSMSAM
jgi:hypothetical protein